MRRRRFLAALGTIIVSALGLAYFGRQRLRDWLLGTSAGQRLREIVLGVDSAAGTAELSAATEATLWALALVVLPSKVDPGAREIVREHLQWRAGTAPGFAAEFDRGRRLLDGEAARRFGAGRGFAALTPDQAGQVVNDLLSGIVAHQLSAGPAGTGWKVLAPRYRGRYRLRRHVVNEILAAYYSSPLGWRRLHYRSFPGACAGLDVYSRPPDGPGAPA